MHDLQFSQTDVVKSFQNYSCTLLNVYVQSKTHIPMAMQIKFINENK